LKTKPPRSRSAEDQIKRTLKTEQTPFSIASHCNVAYGARQARMVGKIWNFICENKKWWIVPILIFLLLITVLLIFAQTSPLSPFMYNNQR
jgi:hypothetical protein